MNKRINVCPYCGSPDGFYYYFDAVNCVFRMGFNGEELDNSEMYDFSETRRRRYVYCNTCDRKIGTVNKFMKQIGRQ